MSKWREGSQKIKTHSENSRFVMICGLPGSGKTKEVEKEIKRIGNKKALKAEDIYPVKNIDMDDLYFIDKEKLNQKALESVGDKLLNNCYTVITANDTRKEMKKFGDIPDSYTFAIIEARINAALSRGCSVIYEATNLDKDIQDKFLHIALTNNISDTKLVICNSTIENAKSRHPDIPLETLIKMDQRLTAAIKTPNAGWRTVSKKNLEKEIGFDRK